MSYRDLRNFTEMLRTLGYPKLVSMEGFRAPNFQLVAEILVWLCTRLDPRADIPVAHSTEEERMKLIRTGAEFVARQISLKLNTKRLYQADGYAVKELLKITTVLYEALRNSDVEIDNDDEPDMSLLLRDFDVSDKISDIKQSRQLVIEITKNGAQLYDLLGKDLDWRSVRNKGVARQYNRNDIEIAIDKSAESIQEEIIKSKELIENVSNTEAELDVKIEKRKTELDRYEKRLETLKKVKPAFLEEFTKAEENLQKLYEKYMVRYRCLMYLEQRATEVDRVEKERMQQHMIATRHMVEQLRLEEHFNEDNSDLGEPEQDENKKQERPRNKAESRNRPLHSSKLYGNMNPDSVMETSTPSSSESESDDNLLDAEEPEIRDSILGSDDDSIGMEISTMEKRAPTGRKTSNQQRREDSDGDF